MSLLQPRIFLAELDSIAVRRLYSDHGHTDAEVETLLVGALRTAHLIGGEVLLTDSMLFDSRFFVDVTPSELATYLGWPPNRLPLTILHQGADLGAALQAKLDKGRDFRWQLAGRDQPSDWRTSEIQQAQERWVRAATRGQVSTEPLLTDRTGRPKPAFTVRSTITSSSQDPLVAELLAATATPDRSRIFDAYDRLLPLSSDDGTTAELGRIRSSWNEAYFDAMAEQHAADWVSVTEAVQGQEGPADGRRVLRVSGTLLELATTAPPAVYAGILYATTPERARFAAHRSQWRLSALAYKVDSTTSSAGLASVIGSLAVSLALAMAVVALSLPGLDDVEGARWTWLLFALGAVLTFPWSALARLWQLRPRRLDTLLSVGAR